MAQYTSTARQPMPTSDMSFIGQTPRHKRAEDLSWQIRFATMKLRNWHDEDNPEWGPLDRLLKVAQAEASDFDPV